MKLTKQNYHSVEANREYMSVSLFKSFLTGYGGCEAKAMAKLNGEYEEPENPAFLLGSYVHAWNEGDLQNFIENNKGKLFTQKGTLYAHLSVGDDMINAIKDDEIAMMALEGEKEVIITEELFGIPWKIMIDSYNPEKKAFTDLKTCREINKTYWNENTRERENFIIHYGYDLQLAVYAEIERRHRGEENHFIPHILAVSKEDPPDKELIMLPTNEIYDILDEIEPSIERIHKVWAGNEEPTRCGRCDYCRSTKKLYAPIYYMDIGFGY